VVFDATPSGLGTAGNEHLWDEHSMMPVDSTIVHELLHDLFQTDHKGIADALGLSTEGSEKEISRRIDTWLNEGCKK